MALAPRLEQRLGQTLIMTPQLRQAIKLLQLSSVELSAFVEQELEKNPLLERDGPDGPLAPEEPAPGDDDRFDAGAARDEPPDSAEIAGSDLLTGPDEAPLDADYGNVYDRDAAEAGAGGPDQDGFAIGAISGRGGRLDFEDGGDLEQTLTREKTLREHLRDQLVVDVTDPVERMIGLHLIDLIDESGYLTEDLAPVAAQLGCDPARVEATLGMLQQFDPPGVFARSLSECLALQLGDRDRLDPAMQALLDNLDLLAKRDLMALEKLCGVTAEDITDMIAEIRSLDPKPGLAFEQAPVAIVVPDVLVGRRHDGGWAIELNNDALPRVLVNRRYYTRVSRAARSKADKSYLAEHFQSANWLVRSLDQRAHTILKVAAELVRQQEGFLTNGVQYLRPLTLRDIAERIEMHESTISRVTTNKYMATPRGVFELKYFFTSAIASSRGGEAHSAESVRHRIKALIDGESPEAAFSDDRIVELLYAEGIAIARRTVAKYREALRIPSSVQRRRIKTVRL